ncbi:MAG: hypothetical protein IIY21_09405 [Clostridiales bacterium]|nr:hypothetical protein [Clostridiales bacterium]
MTGFKDMCQAGMYLCVLTDKFKRDGIGGLPYDATTYLVDKLETLFYDIQTDITLAISNSIEVMGEDE